MIMDIIIAYFKTLFNIVEAPLKKNYWTLMFVLYDDFQMDQ